MARNCKYSDKDCEDRYYSSGKGYHCCRLDEWKRKQGVCPYNKHIFSTPNKIARSIMDKTQTIL